MILVRKNWWGTADLPNGQTVSLKHIMIPGSEEFKKIMNVVKLDEHYEKKMIRAGSVVRLSDDSDDYYFGVNEKHFEQIEGTHQTVVDFEDDGEVIFLNSKNEEYLNREFVNYGITEIIEIIKY